MVLQPLNVVMCVFSSLVLRDALPDPTLCMGFFPLVASDSSRPILILQETKRFLAGFCLLSLWRCVAVVFKLCGKSPDLLAAIPHSRTLCM